jgi:hypothetical protein
MAVIVRKLVEDPTESISDLVIYRSVRHPISNQEKDQAKGLDILIAEKMKEIRDELEEKGLLISGNRGDVHRWYALGCKLRDFVDDPSIVPIEDRMEDRYIWEALWAHAPEGVRPGMPKRSAGTFRDHFRLCYELSKFPAHVVQRFTWSDWVNFLESPAVATDKRVTNWASLKLPLSNRVVLRALASVLRKHFRNRDLSVLTDEELEAELDDAWNEVYIEEI